MQESAPRIHPYLGILLGVIAVSFAAIFIRLCQAHPLVVAFYRMALAALVLLPWMAKGGWSRLAGLGRALLIRAILAGLFLGIHMGTWVTSLYFTSVASSIILVSTQSVFAVLLSHYGIKERASRGVFVAVGIALVGSIIIGGSDLRLGRTTLVGDLLALAGGFTAALYMIIGRRVRQELSVLPYVFLAYSTAAAVLGIGCLSLQVKMWGYPGQTYLWLVLLALVPTHLGHTMFNWALRYLRAYVIGISLLGEPIGATVLAFFIFKEVPALLTFVGGAMVLGGIYLLAREERVMAELVGKKGWA
jgi:drug/metabolite transporter (DMT)-like permease